MSRNPRSFMDQDIAKRAETISKSERLARRVQRSSRARGKNLEESCQLFKQKSRDDFEVLKISNVFQKTSNVFQKTSNVFQKISNVFLDRSEFFSLTAPLSLPCQLRATTSAAYFTMSSGFFQRPAAYFFTWSAWCMRSCLVRR